MWQLIVGEQSNSKCYKLVLITFSGNVKEQMMDEQIHFGSGFQRDFEFPKVNAQAQRPKVVSYCYLIVFFFCPSLCYYRPFEKGDKNRPSAGLRTCGRCTNCFFRPPLETQQTKLSSLGTWQLHNPATERLRRLRLHVLLSACWDKLSPADKKWNIGDRSVSVICPAGPLSTLSCMNDSQWVGGSQRVHISQPVLCLSYSVIASPRYTNWIRCHKDVLWVLLWPTVT